MKSKLKMIALVTLSMVFANCSKEGPVGPAGPVGPTGNANVIGTNVVSLNSSNWSTNNGGALWSTTLTANGITQSIVDKGVVMVYTSYLTDGSNNAWTALPVSFVSTQFSYTFGVGFLNIYATNSVGTAISNPGQMNFRIVIISASNKMAHPYTNWNDYKQVEKALGIKF